MNPSVFSRAFLFFGLALATPQLVFGGPDDPKRPKKPRAPAPEAADQESRAEQAERFTVKVANVTSNLFAPEVERSHGTGFIVALSETEGLVFTNEHVVGAGPLDAQKLVVQFATDSGNPEAIEATLVYKSPMLDFSVVKFDPSKLKRSRAGLRVTKLSSKPVRKGAQVLAFGHPLDTANVATVGVVSGFHVDRVSGVCIQTSAAINPGNSGGPLIDMKTGEVIGINSAKIMGADNTGFVIPIDQVLYDFVSWQKNRELGYGRSLLARFGFYSSNSLKIEHLEELIKGVVPDFFDFHEGLVLIEDAAASSGLKAGDLILVMNKNVFGVQAYAMDRIIHEASKSVDVVVIRNKKLVELKVPVVSLKNSTLRAQVDFAIVGGLVLSEMAPDLSWALTNEQTRVRVSQIIPYSPAAEAESIPPGSAITEIQFGGNSYVVKRLSDVKQALKNRKEDEAVRFVFNPPVIARSEHGVQLLRDPQFGAPIVVRESQVALIPIDQVITPRELSLRLMKAQFDFFGHKPANRDWRTFVRRTGEAHCRQELFELGPELDHAMLM